jgi:two-component system LytT family response regulator
MSEIKTVVIDDEFPNRELIKMLVTRASPEFVIVGEAGNLRDGYTLISEQQPDVVFLDIKMPDGSGFDLLNLFPVINFKAIFVTGFDEYVIKAFEYNAFDYVLKPIDTEKFQNTVTRVSLRILQDRRTNSYQTAPHTSRPFESRLLTMPVQAGNDFMLLDTENVMYVLAEGKNTSVVTKSGKVYASHRPLNDYGFLLDHTSDFIKADNNALINLRHLVDVREDGHMHAVMADGRTMDINELIAQERVLEHFRRHS